MAKNEKVAWHYIASALFLLMTLAVSPIGATGTINIVGGTILATGGAGAAGIGGGADQNSGPINITNTNGTVRQVTAIAGDGVGTQAAIGRGDKGTSGTVIATGTFDIWTSNTTAPPSVKTESGAFVHSESFKYIRLRLEGILDHPPTGLPNLTTATAWLFALFAISAALWAHIAYSYFPRRKHKLG